MNAWSVNAMAPMQGIMYGSSERGSGTEEGHNPVGGRTGGAARQP